MSKPLDILGNELNEQDLVCLKVTEQVVGRIVKISEGGLLAANTQGAMRVPGKIMILVEVYRIFDPDNTRTDCIKVVEPSPKGEKIN